MIRSARLDGLRFLRLLLGTALCLAATPLLQAGVDARVEWRLPPATPAARQAAWQLPPQLDTDRTLSQDDEPEGQPNDAPPQHGGQSHELRERLVAAMAKFSTLTFVPYVWGGAKIGDRGECMACRVCVSAKKHLRVERRLKACQPCRQCGVDCSHFVNRVYKEAGLAFPYLTTRELSRSSSRKLRESYHLVDIGRDLRRAQPGDLLLHRKHVVMLLSLSAPERGDILHVSRSIVAGGIGGIEVAHNQDLRKFRGKVLKILRHVDLLKDAPDALATPHEPRVRNGLGRGMAGIEIKGVDTLPGQPVIA